MCNFEITISKGNLLKKVEEYKVLTKSEVQKTIASGDDGVEETLLPIPNRTVKLYSVNGTAWVTVWESRTLPGKVSSLRLDTFFIFRNILDRVKACSPQFFERLVVDVLVRMGYGGNFVDAAQAVGKTGDGGIDGIIKQDRLGLDRIYIQAKRWEKSVGSPEILAFIGALSKQHANKGVFITTSDYTKAARGTAEGLSTKIVLIDGKHLANLMIDYNAGCSVVRSYDIKKLDPDYFIDEE